MRLVFVVVTFLVSGALAGVLGASYFGPKYIAMGSGWSNNACLCAETARQGAEMLVAYQMKGLLAGAIVGLLLGIGFVVWRKRAKKGADPAAPPAT